MDLLGEGVANGRALGLIDGMGRRPIAEAPARHLLQQQPRDIGSAERFGRVVGVDDHLEGASALGAEQARGGERQQGRPADCQQPPGHPNSPGGGRCCRRLTWSQNSPHDASAESAAEAPRPPARRSKRQNRIEIEQNRAPRPRSVGTAGHSAGLPGSFVGAGSTRLGKTRKTCSTLSTNSPNGRPPL